MAKINGIAVKAVAQSIFGQGRGKANKVMNLPLDKAFRLAQSGAIVNVTVKGSKFTSLFSGMVRVENSLGRSGRPALEENINWELPTGSLTLTLRKLDGSGDVVKLNWRRDHDAIVEFNVQSIPPTAEQRDTVTHKSWEHAAAAPSAELVTPETHQLPAMASTETATLMPDASDAPVVTIDSEHVTELVEALAELPAPAAETAAS